MFFINSSSSKTFKTFFTASLLVASFSSANAQGIFDKDRPAYKANGIKVGSFVINPKLSVAQAYDNNIFSRKTNKIDDSITMVKPALQVQSDWNRHQLGFGVEGDIGIYQDSSSENYQDYSANANGSLEIVRDTFLTADITVSEKHEDRGSPDSNSSAVEPTKYSLTDGNIGFERSLRKVSFKLDQNVKSFDYKNGNNNTGGNIDNEGRDRDQYRTNARLAYEFIPSYNIFVEGAYDLRDYEQKTNNLDRSSDGYEGRIGTSVNITGKIKGEIYGGYMEQDYDGDALVKINGISYGAQIEWSPTSLTFVNLRAGRTIEETALSGFSGYESDAYNLRIEHELLRNVLLGVEAGYSENNYEGNTITSIREDELVNAGADIKYLLNRNLTAKLSYKYNKFNSTSSSEDFSKNLVMLSIGIAL